MARSDEHRAFHRHRLALTVADPNATADTVRQAIAEIAQFGPAFYTDFLPRQGLSSYWHHTLEQHGLADVIEPAVRSALKQARLSETVSYMAQKAALQELDRLFEAKRIRYAVIKGTHVRELVYHRPGAEAGFRHRHSRRPRTADFCGQRLERSRIHALHQSGRYQSRSQPDQGWCRYRPALGHPASRTNTDRYCTHPPCAPPP